MSDADQDEQEERPAGQAAEGPDAKSDSGSDERKGPKPWTIKHIPADVRQAALDAADRDGVQIGQWMSRAIIEQIKRDRQASRGGLAVIPTAVAEAQQQAQVADPAAELSSIERMVALASQLAQAAGEPPPKTVTRTAYGLLKERLAAMKTPAPAPATKRRAPKAAAEAE